MAVFTKSNVTLHWFSLFGVW